MLGRVATAIGESGGTIGNIALVEQTRRHVLRDITIDAGDEAHEQGIVDAVKAVDGAEVVDWWDRTFGLHVGGKLEVHLKHALTTVDDLSMAYTPGVARVCSAIAADPARPTSTRSSETRWRSSPTAAPCSAWATSARRPRCP